MDFSSLFGQAGTGAGGAPVGSIGNSGGDSGSSIDPQTLQSVLKALPAIQQAQRRATQLRQQQAGFQALQQAPGNGNSTPTQNGGLYQTVAQWRPDYAQQGNQIAGALGSAYMNGQANTAEDQYNALRNQQIMQGLNGIGSNGGGTGGIGSGGGTW